jgi:hypothetical protein
MDNVQRVYSKEKRAYLTYVPEQKLLVMQLMLLNEGSSQSVRRVVSAPA